MSGDGSLPVESGGDGGAGGDVDVLPRGGPAAKAVSGLLKKHIGMLRGWRAFWFELRVAREGVGGGGGVPGLGSGQQHWEFVRYQSKVRPKDGEEPKRVVNLSGGISFAVSSSKSLAFDVRMKGKQYLLQASSTDDLNRWLTALSAVQEVVGKLNEAGLARTAADTAPTGRVTSEGWRSEAVSPAFAGLNPAMLAEMKGLGFDLGGGSHSGRAATGKLTVNIVRATNLTAKNRDKLSSDPYAVVHVGKERRKTKVVTKCLDPMWNETFEIDFSRRSSIVRIDLFDQERITKDSFLGRVVIPLTTVADKHLQQWHVLGKRGPRSHVSGELLVGLSTDVPTSSALLHEFQLVRNLLDDTLSLNVDDTDAVRDSDEEGHAAYDAHGGTPEIAQVTIPPASLEEVEDCAEVVLRSHTTAARAAHSPGHLYLSNYRLIFVSFDAMLSSNIHSRSGARFAHSGAIDEIEGEEADVEVTESTVDRELGLSTSIPLGHIRKVRELVEDPSSGLWALTIECVDFRDITFLFRPPMSIPKPSAVLGNSQARRARHMSDATRRTPSTKVLKRQHTARTLRAVSTAVHSTSTEALSTPTTAEHASLAQAAAARFYFRMRFHSMNRVLLGETMMRLQAPLLLRLVVDGEGSPKPLDLPSRSTTRKRHRGSALYPYRRVSYRHAGPDIGLFSLAGSAGGDASTATGNVAEAMVEAFPTDVAVKLATGWDTYDIETEFARQGVPNKHWRITRINEEYELCKSYPRLLAVPVASSDADLRSAAPFRSKNRIPVLSWRHPLTGATICRSSQPMVGLKGARNRFDEGLFEAIRNASHSPAAVYKVMDARPKINAQANRTQGKGYESCGPEGHYRKAQLHFMDIGNIHVMRKSLDAVRHLCNSPVEGLSDGTNMSGGSDGGWLSALGGTGWLQHVGYLIAAAVSIVRQVDQQGVSVLVHCSDGWDRTAQLCALAQVLMDPYYRTIEGFQVLIDKDWLHFGHKFGDRLAWSWGGYDSAERSPIFLQWLDAVFQVLRQFPNAFEFNSKFLSVIADHSSSGWFGTFWGNNQRERETAKLRETTLSLWSYISNAIDDFKSHSYVQPRLQEMRPVVLDSGRKVRAWNQDLVLIPAYSSRSLSFWQAQYLRWDSRAYHARWLMDTRAVWSRQDAALESWARSRADLSGSAASRSGDAIVTPRDGIAARSTSDPLVDVSPSGEEVDDEAAEPFDVDVDDELPSDGEETGEDLAPMDHILSLIESGPEGGDGDAKRQSTSSGSSVDEIGSGAP